MINPITQPLSSDADKQSLKHGGNGVKISGSFLIIVALIGIAVSLYLLLSPMPPLPPNASEGYKNGWTIAKGFRQPLPLAVNFFAFVAGIGMVTRQAYGFAVLGCVAAMFPCNTTFCLNVPVAIWCLYSLTRPGVEASFHQ